MSKNTPDFNDPINLQVMRDRLIFIADQADNVLGRTAFSPIVRENHDYVTVLLDSRGRASPSAWSIPVFITSLPVAAQKYFLPKFPVETLSEGDVLATNDPEIGTGHLPDVTMITPIFKKGRVVAYAGSIAHLPDVGGRPLHSRPAIISRRAFASRSSSCTRPVFRNQDVPRYHRRFRAPADRSARRSRSRWSRRTMSWDENSLKFLDEYELDEIDGLADAIHSRSEAQTRKAIRAMAERHLHRRVLLDGLRCRCEAEGRGDRAGRFHPRRLCRLVGPGAALDQLPDQLPLRPFGLCLEMPAGSGHAEQRRLHHPDHRRSAGGSILNPNQWTAGNSRNLIGHVIPSLIFKALEKVVPEKVMGDSGGAPIWAANCVGQRDDGTQYGSVQNFHGGQGARSEIDGLDTLSFPSNCKVTAIEMFEIAVPVPDRVQGADCGLGRRRKTSRRARPARYPAQSRQGPHEHLPCL